MDPGAVLEAMALTSWEQGVISPDLHTPCVLMFSFKPVASALSFMLLISNGMKDRKEAWAALLPFMGAGAALLPFMGAGAALWPCMEAGAALLPCTEAGTALRPCMKAGAALLSYKEAGAALLPCAG